MSNSGSSYTLRRTYLLHRAAWGLLGIAAFYAIFGGEYKSWWLVVICVALAALCWWLAGSIEKRRRNRTGGPTDENGNALPNKL